MFLFCYIGIPLAYILSLFGISPEPRAPGTGASLAGYYEWCALCGIITTIFGIVLIGTSLALIF